MFVILPFEKEFYQRFDYEVNFVGHPLLDAVANYSKEQNSLSIDASKPIIALLPGSRKQEIATMLPLMLSLKDQYAYHQFVIAGAHLKQKNTIKRSSVIPVFRSCSDKHISYYRKLMRL